MKDKEFNFKESLKLGKKGEEVFFKKYGEQFNLKQESGIEYDFSSENIKIELKTDFYDMNKTSNFFIETKSSIEQNKDGGPFQSLNNNVDYYIYYFIKNDTYFIFDVKQLCNFINKTIDNYEISNMKNDGYTTQGLKVPRKDLEHLFLEVY